MLFVHLGSFASANDVFNDLDELQDLDESLSADYESEQADETGQTVINIDGSQTFGAHTLKLQAPFPGQNKTIGDKNKGAVGILEEYVSQIYIFGSGLVSLVAVLWITIGGYEIMFSSSSGDMSSGKEKIIQSLLGLAIVFLSGLILYTINPNFFTW